MDLLTTLKAALLSILAILGTHAQSPIFGASSTPIAYSTAQAQVLANTSLPTAITNSMNTINSFETTYHSTNGIYWQGLATSNIIPNLGSSTAAVNLNTKPSYETKSWAQLGFSTAVLPFQITIDQYVNPDASEGYLTTFRVSNFYVFSKVMDSNGLQSHDWQ